ncbi:hypothetical protein D3C87_2014360 [compost metagenome]
MLGPARRLTLVTATPLIAAEALLMPPKQKSTSSANIESDAALRIAGIDWRASVARMSCER